MLDKIKLEDDHGKTIGYTVAIGGGETLFFATEGEANEFIYLRTRGLNVIINSASAKPHFSYGVRGNYIIWRMNGDRNHEYLVSKPGRRFEDGTYDEVNAHEHAATLVVKDEENDLNADESPNYGMGF